MYTLSVARVIVHTIIAYVTILFLLLQVIFQLITPTNSYIPFCVLLHFHDKCIQKKSVALATEQMIAKIIHNHNNSKCTTSVAASQCGYTAAVIEQCSYDFGLRLYP